jgi:hypothetical protein
MDKEQEVVGDYNYQIDLSSFQSGIYILLFCESKVHVVDANNKYDVNNSGSDVVIH